MSRRKKPEARCEVCQMRKEICICRETADCRARMATTTRLRILMHYREFAGTTNTARLAKLAIPDCEIILRGRPDDKLAAEQVSDSRFQSLLLFPSDDAIYLTEDLVKSFTKPILLLVPDGSWRQASKVPKREPLLAQVPHVKITVGEPSRYRLRREPKVEGLATFEAISRALGVIEGAVVQTCLDELFEIMVSRTLKSRGAV